MFNRVAYGNISDITIKNNNFRKVISTTATQQLVVMSLLPKEDIGKEVHPDITQFFRIEQGHGLAIVNGEKIKLGPDDFLVVPNNTVHNIINISNKKLKLYTIYSPPNHPFNRIDRYKPLN